MKTELYLSLFLGALLLLSGCVLGRLHTGNETSGRPVKQKIEINYNTEEGVAIHCCAASFHILSASTLQGLNGPVSR